MPGLVFASDSKTDCLTNVEGVESATDVFESENGLIPFDGHFFVGGTEIGDVDAVVASQSNPRQALGDGLLVAWVDVASFANIVNDGLTCVGQCEGVALGFTKFRPVTVTGFSDLIAEVGELDPVEREVALAPCVAPLRDHECEEIVILVGTPGVTLALIPDSAADAVSDDGIEDTGPKVTGTVLASKDIAGRAGYWFSCFFCCCCFLFPGRHDFVEIEGGFGLLPFSDDCFETVICFENIAGNPCFCGGTTPGVVDQTDRDA